MSKTKKNIIEWHVCAGGHVHLTFLNNRGKVVHEIALDIDDWDEMIDDIDEAIDELGMAIAEADDATIH